VILVGERFLKYVAQMRAFPKGLSVNTVPPILMDVYSRVFAHVCTTIGQSTNLAILIDGTTDRKQRNPIAIRLTGLDDKKKVWSYPLRFCERVNHTSETQLHEIEQMLEVINKFNKGGQGRQLSVVDITAIVFDNTGGNTGLTEGLAGKLIEARQNKWKSLGLDGNVPELVVQGCEDHLINLMSNDLEKYLFKTSPNVTKTKHYATDLVQFLINKVGMKRRSFRHFMSLFNITKFAIPRISDTRFAWRDIATLFVWKFLYFILFFIITVTDVTEKEMKRLMYILKPEVVGVIALRAVFAHDFLLPGMKKVNSISSG